MALNTLLMCFYLIHPIQLKGKALSFVEKALKRMNNGRAVVLIQENADGNGLPYTKNILENNTTVASIHMSDIFHGKAGVENCNICIRCRYSA